MRTEKRVRLESGFSLVELLIAMFIMAIGLAAIAILMTSAIAANQRNKVNTTSTMLAQTVLDQIAAKQANDNGNISINDCTGTAKPIATAPGVAPGGSGAALLLVNGVGTLAGDIDYTQTFAAVPANYKMLYTDCGANGTQINYEVRWNVMSMPAAMGATTATFVKVVTVTARQQNAGTNLGFFARPVTLRTIVGGNN